jgi:hypothetical protein
MSEDGERKPSTGKLPRTPKVCVKRLPLEIVSLYFFVSQELRNLINAEKRDARLLVSWSIPFHEKQRVGLLSSLPFSNLFLSSLVRQSPRQKRSPKKKSSNSSWADMDGSAVSRQFISHSSFPKLRCLCLHIIVRNF